MLFPMKVIRERSSKKEREERKGVGQIGPGPTLKEGN